MNKRLRRLFASILLVAFLMGNWAATEYFAFKLGYQKLLGSPAFSLGDYLVYYPWDFFVWFARFSGDAPGAFARGFTIIGMVFGAGIMVVAVLKRNLIKKPLSSCGTAHFATVEDMQEAKLLDGKGIFLGKTEDGRYLRDNDNRHALVVSPTRGGKGVGLVTPTGLSWSESAVFVDIKGEIYGLTAGYRKEVLGQTIIKFDPTNPVGSARYNPLDEIRMCSENEIKDCVNIVHAIARPDGSDKPDHWRDLAASMVEGVVLHLKYMQQGDVCFGDVLRFIFGEIPIRERLREMSTAQHGCTPEQAEFLRANYGAADGVHPFVKQKAFTFLQKEDREFAGIMSTVEEILKDFFDPILDKNTSQSSFKIHDLMNRDEAVSLYLIVPPSDLSRMAKFFRLIVVLIYQRLTEKMEFEAGRPVEHYKHKLLLLLDEFPALGRIIEFEKALGYIAGYGLRAFIIIQGLNQLFAPQMYGRNTSIIDNCHIRVFHTPNDSETPTYMSNMMGKETIEVRSRAFQNDLLQFLGENSYSVQEKGRELMTAAEISEMDAEDEIIFVAGRAPIRCKKIRYFKDRNFVSRLREAPATDSLYSLEERTQRKAAACEALVAADEEKIVEARRVREMTEKLDAIKQEQYLKEAEKKVAAYEESQKKERDEAIEVAIGSALAVAAGAAAAGDSSDVSVADVRTAALADGKTAPEEEDSGADEGDEVARGDDGAGSAAGGDVLTSSGQGEADEGDADISAAFDDFMDSDFDLDF